MRTDTIEKASDEFTINLESAIRMRVKYLQSLLALWVSYIDEKINEIPESDVMAIIGELASIKRYQDRAKKGIVLKGIDDEMIQRAREYPITSLVEFNRGKALCFMHPDKAPSLSYHGKTNTARCFVCDKSVNSLDVLILRDGYSFIDAVKTLSGGI